MLRTCRSLGQAAATGGGIRLSGGAPGVTRITAALVRAGARV